jgi:ribosome-binding factor A
MPRDFQRTHRVASVLREIVAELIVFEVKDPRVAGVTVTDAEVTADLREARVYVYVPGDERRQKQALRGLKSAAGFMRKALGERMRMRATPTIEFRFDGSLDYGERIDRKLAELGLGEGAEPGADE